MGRAFRAKKLPAIGEGLGKTIKEIRNIRSETKPEEKKEGEKKGAKENLMSDLKKEADGIPGLREAREIRDTAKKVKNLTRFLK